MSERLFLVDAMVLIDLGYVRGLGLLPEIGITEVLDVVLEECRHPKQPGLECNVRRAGIVVVETQTQWLRTASSCRAAELSIEDSLSLYYAKVYNRTLLTNEKQLRRYCSEHGVGFHGTLWLIEQGFLRGLRPVGELLHWLEILPTYNRRLPRSGIRHLKELMHAGLRPEMRL